MCFCVCVFVCIQHIYIYRVIQEESAILWEMIVCVILSKKVHMNTGPILNGTEIWPVSLCYID
jgi:hypothetical protein